MTLMTALTQGVAGLILAGGSARRMGGGDKSLLAVGGRSILARAIEAMEEIPTKAISANGDVSRFNSFGLPVLSDGPFEGSGPLAGILAGLRWADWLGKDVLLSVPGDMPFLTSDVINAILPAPRAAFAGGRYHYLLASWPTKFRADLRRLLESGALSRAADFADYLGMVYVELAIESSNRLINVNMPDDLAYAQSIAETRDGPTVKSGYRE